MRNDENIMKYYRVKKEEILYRFGESFNFFPCVEYQGKRDILQYFLLTY